MSLSEDAVTAGVPQATELVPRFDLQSAHYIKLGAGGAWAADSLVHGKLRIGWSAQALSDVNEARWADIERQLREQQPESPRGTVTKDFNSLRTIAESTPADVWITFHDGKLWWGRVTAGPMGEDEISKFRYMEGGWSDRDLNGRLLLASQLPGKISQLAGYRATHCRVNDPALLERVIRGIPGPISLELRAHRQAAARAARTAIEALHWRDYEILVDMVFRSTGWIRESVLGEQEKGYDLMLREAITGDRHVVQVKSQAGRVEVEKVAVEFPPEVCQRIFFVVHTPAADLREDRRAGLPEHVTLVDPERLAELAIQAGLSTWLENKMA